MKTWILLALALGAPAAAAARPAECYVEVDGAVAIDGRCDFDALGDDGSFQVSAVRGDAFAQVNVARAGLADGWWNEGWGGHAHAPLGRLARNDACWSNERATVCAW